MVGVVFSLTRNVCCRFK